MYLGLRILAAALLASSFTLLVSGSHSHHVETRQMFFSWGLLLGIAGIVWTACLFLHTTIRSEGDRNARVTAEAVGVAVGEVLQAGELDDVPRPRLPTRRDI